MSVAAVVVLVGAILWFLPEICSLSVDTTPVDVTLMKQYTLWVWPAWIGKSVAFVAVMGLAFRVSYIIRQQQVICVRSYMPLLFVVLCWSVSDSIQMFDERYFAMLLFVSVWRWTLLLYRQNGQVEGSFNAMLCIGAASFFDPRFIWLALVVFLGLAVYRTVTQRVFLSIFLAAVVLSFLSWSIFWMFDNTEALTNTLKIAADFAFGGVEILTLPSAVVGGVLTVLLVIVMAFNSIANFGGNYNLRMRQNYALTNSILVSSLLWTICFGGKDYGLSMVPLLFVAVNFALYFSTAKGKLVDVMFYIAMAAFILYRLTTIPEIVDLIMK